MMDMAVSALFRAWLTTVVAISLLIAGVALARAWDGAIYLQLLEETWTLDG
jgi:sulfite exporter TauE/SafE